MMSLHFHNSKKNDFSFLPQNRKCATYKSMLFMRTEKNRTKKNGRKSTEYEDNISAHEVAKLQVAGSWENVWAGQPCKLVLFLTRWPLSDTGLTGPLISSRMAIFCTPHVVHLL